MEEQLSCDGELEQDMAGAALAVGSQGAITMGDPTVVAREIP
jgi:hypothetical protein